MPQENEYYNRYIRAADMAVLCGTSQQAISFFKKKGDVIANEDKLYDLENEKNANFIKKQQAKRPHLKEKKEPKTTATIDAEELDLSDLSEETLEALDKRKKILDNQKKELEIKLLQFKEEQTKGNLIPSGMVSNLISHLSRQFGTSYADQIELFIIDFCHKHKLNATVSAAMNGELKAMINTAHAKAIETAKADLKSVIEQSKTV